MYPASARSPHTRSSARLAPMFPGFGMHRRLHLGSDYVRSGRSAVGRSYIQRVVASETASLWHCAWEPILCTTPTTISVSSSVASHASLEKLRPSRQRPTSLLALSFTCSTLRRPTTRAYSADAKRKL